MTYPIVIVFTPFAIVMTLGFIVCAALLGVWARSAMISRPPLLVSTPQRVGKLPGVFNLRSIRILLRAVQQWWAIIVRLLHDPLHFQLHLYPCPAWNAYYVSISSPLSGCQAANTTMYSATSMKLSYWKQRKIWKHLAFWYVTSSAVQSLISYTNLCKDVGYNYVSIDDCYSEKNRSSSGDIVASAIRAFLTAFLK